MASLCYTALPLCLLLDQDLDGIWVLAFSLTIFSDRSGTGRTKPSSYLLQGGTTEEELMASLAEDWALRQEDLRNSFENAGSQEQNPMHATLGCTKKTETAYDDMSIRHSEASAEPSLFVHEHLMSILKPFAEHVQELEKQVRGVRDEQIAQSVGVGAVAAAQKTLEEASACLKLDLTKVKSNAARSHEDVTKLIEVFSQANQERQEKLRKQFEEEILDVRSSLNSMLPQQEETRSRVISLESKAQVTADQLKADAFTLQHLQEACELNKFCFHGLSDRLEVTKTHGEATQSELLRLKTVESCHHQEAVDTIARLTRRLDHTDSKVKHNHEDISRTASVLGIRLDSAEKGLTSVEEAIAALDANMQATLLQYDKEQASEESKQMNALERLAHHVHRIREELVELAAKNHAKATEGISKVAAAAGANRDKLQLHDVHLETLDGRTMVLERGLEQTKAHCSDLERALDSYGTRMRSAEDEIRDLIYCKDQMAADVDELQDSSQKVKSRLRIAEDGLQVPASRWSG
eukprot:s1424_g9.t2